MLRSKVWSTFPARPLDVRGHVKYVFVTLGVEIGMETRRSLI